MEQGYAMRKRRRKLNFAQKCRAYAAFEDSAIDAFVLERAEEIIEECSRREPFEIVSDLDLESWALVAWYERGSALSDAERRRRKRVSTATEVASRCYRLAAMVRRATQAG